MAWIKRNLFLVVGGLLAVLLLGAGGYYFWTNAQKNKTIEAQLEENKNNLTRLVNQDPTPNRTNIARAKEEFERARAAAEEAKLFFQPVPFEPVTGQAFKSVLDQTIFDLQAKADEKSIALPSKQYAFTFGHQKMQLQFPAEAFPALPQQLAEIRTICNLLFDAKINRLITVRRSRIYSEEPVSQVDHHDRTPEVNQAMGVASNPYEVTMHAFTPELAVALELFYKSTNGLVVKSVQVEVAPAQGDPNASPGTAPGVAPFTTTPVPSTGATQPVARQFARPGAPVAARPQEMIKTVLNERLLKIIIVIDVMRTLPPDAKKA
jgi:hypothetical protein